MIKNSYFTNKELRYFFEDFQDKRPSKLMALMFVSVGFYLVTWMFFMNKKIEELDLEAPDSQRGSIILFFMPVLWALVMLVLKSLIFSGDNLAIGILEIVGWGIIIFLSLKYIYDFCVSFGRVTQSSGTIWYFFIYPGYLSIILAFFEFYFTLPLIFFTIVAVPSMQSFINLRYKQVHLKKTRDYFNVMEKGNVEK